MKIAYPIVISKNDKNYLVSIPDLEIDTQGNDVVDAIEMARDAISVWCVCEIDDFNRRPPEPTPLSEIRRKRDEIATLVDADIDAYRRTLENRAVKKTLTIPSWLNEKAVGAGINFSHVLQKALKEELSG